MPAATNRRVLAAPAEGCACCSRPLSSFIRIEDGTPGAFQNELKVAFEPAIHPPALDDGIACRAGARAADYP
jgi:hypothetical protein